MKTVLTDEQIVAILDARRPDDGGDSMALAIAVSRAIEQAVLQSEQVKAWKRDAERWQKSLEEKKDQP